MGSTLRGVVPHKSVGNFTQPGNYHENKSNTKTEGQYQQPGMEVPRGNNVPVIDSKRING